MKICLVHEEYPDETNFGGIATYQKSLAENLVKAGLDVIVLARSLECDKEYIENGVKVIRLYVKETEDIYQNYVDYRMKVSDKLVELQKNDEIDLIEVPDWGAETVLFEKYRKVPLIVRLHTPLAVWSKANQATLDPSIHKQMLRWEKKMIESADYVTSCTNILKDLVKEELSLTRDDIEVIPNPANLKDFYSKTERKDKNKTILYCGSLEQRKGILLFAEAIPKIIDELGNVKIVFVGKDTIRNDKNISTMSYIKEIIPTIYHKNIEFKGQLLNEELNDIYNSACIGVYPSLFDNFPYVALESMACGLPFVGSINSGVKEMLDTKTQYLYDGKSSDDLARKVIHLYENKKEQKSLSKYMLERIKNEYDAEKIVDKFIKLYQKTVNQYNKKIVKDVIKKHIKEDIVKIEKLEGGIANIVYFVETIKKKYVVKIYKKDIDKRAIKSLLDIASNNNFNVLKTTDDHFYNYRNATICIYDYIEGKKTKKLTNEQIEKVLNFIKLDKKSPGKVKNLLDKVNLYYESLRNFETKKIRREIIDELLRRYMKLQNYNIFYEKELVHGDITPDNIIWHDNGEFTLIDLDETVEFTKLYDLIVFAIKFSKNGSEIDVKLAKKILKPFGEYTKIDIINIWNFYLLKVILEKIYLYEIGKIDLLDENQMRDNWEDWLKILNSSVIEDILNK